MDKILEVYNLIRNGETLTENMCLEVINSKEIRDYQLSSLLVMLHYKKCCDFEKGLKDYIVDKIGNKYIRCLDEQTSLSKEFELNMIYLAKNKLEIGEKNFQKLINKYIDNILDLNFLSFWLMVIVHKGLSKADIKYFSEAMIQREDIVDYRENYLEKEYFFIRRYPTGGLSEKTALILPSLLAATAKEHKIKSNFLIAKSLGYTGGTLDKLSSLDGFRAPDNSKEIRKIIDEFSVVMSSTSKSIAYADKKLYSYRSITGTVESIPLIAASIASKQLSIPCDYLLMDIRYGKFAFIKSKKDGQILGKLINEILGENQQHSDFILTNAEKPNGDTIGNILEVVEALDVIKYEFDKSIFRVESLKEQFELILKFYTNLMSTYKVKEPNYWRGYAIKLFENKLVEKSFYELLSYHGVKYSEIEKLRQNNYSYIFEKHVFTVCSNNSGRIKKIKYDSLGFFVNYHINSVDYRNKSLSNGGIILKVDINDEIISGQILCDIYSRFIISEQCKEDIKQCFIFE